MDARQVRVAVVPPQFVVGRHQAGPLVLLQALHAAPHRIEDARVGAALVKPQPCGLRARDALPARPQGAHVVAAGFARVGQHQPGDMLGRPALHHHVQRRPGLLHLPHCQMQMGLIDVQRGLVGMLPQHGIGDGQRTGVVASIGRQHDQGLRCWQAVRMVAQQRAKGRFRLQRLAPQHLPMSTLQAWIARPGRRRPEPCHGPTSGPGGWPRPAGSPRR